VEFSIDNQTDKKIDLDFLEKIALSLTHKDIELIFCYNEYIQDINAKFRQKNQATDVLSFPYEEMPMMPLGSIVISIDFVNEKSKQYNHSFDNELSLLFIHGLLHLLGFDHEIDNGEHRNKEEELIAQFKLPDSLIIRNL
jgi:probable rRNA maturation factor